MPAGFCSTAWERTSALQQAICDHPFNRALAAGTLDPERFAFYLVQDSRYLVGFSRALATAAARAPGIDEGAFFAQSAHTALVAERSLHRAELERLGWDDERAADIGTAPTCVAYSSYLGSVALGEPWPVLVAALLPCFWVYHHVGRTINARTPELATHPYRAWIATYADEAFAASVGTIRQIADRAAAGAPAETTDRMLRAFTRATEYEWLFWDSAWRRETWPTAQWLPRGLSGPATESPGAGCPRA
ncbi:MAG: TenA family protein [Acidimicrobiales bacterium]